MSFNFKNRPEVVTADALICVKSMNNPPACRALFDVKTMINSTYAATWPFCLSWCNNSKPRDLCMEQVCIGTTNSESRIYISQTILKALHTFARFP